MADKKILVIYYSRSGNTERVAKDIAAKLGADLEKITDNKNRSGFFGYLYGGRDATLRKPTEIGGVTRDPAAYDVVVMGTPVWAWTMTPAVRTYISRFKGVLKAVAFFTTSGGVKPDGIVKAMEDLAGKKAVAFTGFDQRELKNETVYNERIAAFTAAILK